MKRVPKLNTVIWDLQLLETNVEAIKMLCKKNNEIFLKCWKFFGNKLKIIGSLREYVEDFGNNQKSSENLKRVFKTVRTSFAKF